MDDPAPMLEPAPTPIPLADASPRPNGAWRGYLALAVLAFIAGIVATIYGVRWYQGRTVTTTRTSTTTPPAAQPLTAAQPAGAAPPPITADSLAAREAELSARLAGLEARTASVSTDARAAQGNAGRAEALLITFAARRAIERGQPLGYAADELRVRFGASQPGSVNAVLQASAAPVTLEDLRAGLDGVAPLLTSTVVKEGWFASFRREMGSLIVIHHAGTPSTLPGDRLTRAQRMLDAGQVEGALAEVRAMPGASSAASWITAAQRYVAARQALDTLEAAAVQGQAAPPPA